MQLFDANAKPTEKGTVEAWWTSPTTYQVAYTFPSYTAVEVHSEAGLNRTKDAGSPPFYVALLLKQVVHPMPSDKDVLDSILAIRKLTLTKVPLECVMLAQKIDDDPLPPLGIFPTVLLQHRNQLSPDQLRLRLPGHGEEHDRSLSGAEHRHGCRDFGQRSKAGDGAPEHA